MSNERYKKILVPVDLSDASLEAWCQAIDLAGRTDGSIEVVHVVAPRASKDRARQKREVLRQLREKLDHPSRVHVLPGNPSSVILRLIRDLKPDVIVMGTHGRTGLARLILGSVAETVIEHSPVPVLAIHKQAQSIESVLVPVALTHYAVTGIAQAVEIASILNASITFLHVSKNPQDGADPTQVFGELIGRLPRNIQGRCRLQVQVSDADPPEAILSNAIAHDMMIIVSHRKEPFKDWAFGTTVERVLERSPIPVLALPYLTPSSPMRHNILKNTFNEQTAP